VHNNIIYYRSRIHVAVMHGGRNKNAPPRAEVGNDRFCARPTRIVMYAAHDINNVIMCNHVRCAPEPSDTVNPFGRTLKTRPTEVGGSADGVLLAARVLLFRGRPAIATVMNNRRRPDTRYQIIYRCYGIGPLGIGRLRDSAGPYRTSRARDITAQCAISVRSAGKHFQSKKCDGRSL